MNLKRAIQFKDDQYELVTNNASAVFSLEESESYYLVSIDIPIISATGTKILTKKNEILIEGNENNIAKEKKTFFRCHSQSGGMKAAYQDGMLWLLLPKIQALPKGA